MSTQSQTPTAKLPNAPAGANALAPSKTPLAPWPGTRTADEGDPFTVPAAPKEGEPEGPPPVMVTQDVTSPGRTISTNFDPRDQLEPEPPGGSLPGGGGEAEAPVTTTVAIDAATIAGLSTTPKLLVPVPAGASLEFQGATGQYTYGTATYTGSGVLQIKCGGTVVSDDVAVTPLTGAVSGPITFTALPGIALAADQPITLTQSGGSLVGGDGTLSLDVTTATHPPAGAGASVQAASYSAVPPSTLAPRSAAPGHMLSVRKSGGSESHSSSHESSSKHESGSGKHSGGGKHNG